MILVRVNETQRPAVFGNDRTILHYWLSAKSQLSGRDWRPFRSSAHFHDARTSDYCEVLAPISNLEAKKHPCTSSEAWRTLLTYLCTDTSQTPHDDVAPELETRVKLPSLRSWIAAGASLMLAAAGLTMATTSANAEETQPAASTQHQWLTGYWHNFDNGSTVIKVSDIPEAYNLVAIAFADNLAGKPGGITFNLETEELNGYTVSEFKADIAAAQDQGRKVIISVGGEKGNVLINNPTAAKNFADTTYDLMQEYGFDGVDIDLEHGIDAKHISDALHQLSAKVGPELIIAMAPQTIDYQAVSMPYYKLTENIKDILTIVNMQYYNSGAMMGCNNQVYSQGSVDFLTSLACIQLEMGLRPDQVGLGLPAVPAGAGGGHQPLNNIVKAVDCLENGENCGNFVPETPYGPIGGVMTWSVNWDATNNYQFAQTMSQRLNLGGAWTPPDPVDPDPTEPTDPDPTDPVDPEPTDPTDPTDPPTCNTTAWSASSVYTAGATVSYQGKHYVAKWWVQGDVPGASVWGPWTATSDCDATDPVEPTPDPTTPVDPEPTTDPTTTTPPATDCPAAWKASAVYQNGDTVSYNGTKFSAKWWTTNEAPSAAEYGPWKNEGKC